MAVIRGFLTCACSLVCASRQNSVSNIATIDFGHLPLTLSKIVNDRRRYQQSIFLLFRYQPISSSYSNSNLNPKLTSFSYLGQKYNFHFSYGPISSQKPESLSFLFLPYPANLKVYFLNTTLSFIPQAMSTGPRHHHLDIYDNLLTGCLHSNLSLPKILLRW